jgi:hypothetical protein
MAISNTTISVISLIIMLLIGFVVSSPEFIPSFRPIQYVFILIIYLIIIGLTFIIAMQIRSYIYTKFSGKKAGILARLSSFLFVTFIFLLFILTTSNIKNGLINNTLVEELHYPTHDTSLYIYENNQRIPLVSIKIKDNILPVMHNVAFIENQRAIELKNWRNHDTVFFVGKHIEVIFDLNHRKAVKKYKVR